MGNSNWHVRFLDATLSNLQEPISDHTPILLDTLAYPIPRVRRPFRFHFENKCLGEPDLVNVVTKSWRGFHDFDILRCLKATSDVLGDWGKHIATVWRQNKRTLRLKFNTLFRYGGAHKYDCLCTSMNQLTVMLV